MKSCPLAEPEKFTSDSSAITSSAVAPLQQQVIYNQVEKETPQIERVETIKRETKPNKQQRSGSKESSRSKFESLRRFEHPEKLLGSTTSSTTTDSTIDQGTVTIFLLACLL